MGRRFIIKNPNGPPGKSQVNFALKLGIEIPEGTTKGELDKMIETVLVNNASQED